MGNLHSLTLRYRLRNKYEFWKDIPTFEELYQVSNLGRVRSYDREHNSSYGSRAIKKGKIMSLRNSFGYLQIGLTNKFGNRVFFKVHRLVIGTFYPLDNFTLKRNENHKYIQVDHIDNNKLNNRIDNLQYISASENVKKCFDNGKIVWNKGKKGYKYTEEQLINHHYKKDAKGRFCKK